ncbi:MAG: DUF4142 domain-containing protein [Chloroflexota bacterium]|nr:DUF4142 domain-containing protein [Chloroflexota bacterium]
MKTVRATKMSLILLILCTQVGIANAEESKKQTNMIDRASVDRTIANWPNRPKLGANEMMAKYGVPQEVTSEKLVWLNPGAYKRIMVTREEIPHDFPKPHMDFLEHTISYNVPLDKTQDLIEFDGSSTINRTAGELSARCDLEGHNVLTLNLDHDIVMGKKSVQEARKAFGEIVVQDVKGEHPAYIEALQFEPTEMLAARFADKPVIPGSPIRVTNSNSDAKAMMGDVGAVSKTIDAETLAFVIAIDDNEILAASEAGKKKLRADVMAYAKMLQMVHGQNLVATMKLGERIDIVPTDTEAVDTLRVKGAGELAALVPLDGEKFEKAYLAAMVNGHEEVLGLIDSKLSKTASNDELKQHLTETREHVAAHLAEAKRLQTLTKSETLG